MKSTQKARKKRVAGPRRAGKGQRSGTPSGETAAGATTPKVSPAKGEVSPAKRGEFVGSWVELARALRVSRRAIQEWREDPRYAKYWPRAASDGRHDVQAWRSFMIQFRLKRADEDVETP